MVERLDRFMTRANAAYYATHDPFADFTTAPEISQMFGELLGAWIAVAWAQLGSPAPFILAEAGPGRGTLMEDALRTIARVAPLCHAALRLVLIETSPRLRAAQSARLPAARFVDTLEHVPPGPLVLLANEFLDALPIRQFVRRPAGWQERHVHAGRWQEQPATDPGLTADEGEIVERSPAAIAFVQTLATRLATTGGIALLIDYGPARSAPGDSLQALHLGRPADPLADPGSRDLTAHVDFQSLAAAARAAGAIACGPQPQGALLERLGLFARARALAAGQPAAAALAIMEQAARLAQPERMGALFKALALTAPNLPPPPGFDP